MSLLEIDKKIAAEGLDVLVIEDDPLIAKTIRLAWPVKTDRLRFTANYKQSLGLIHGAELRFFDGAIIDINLPDGDGLTILREIRSHSSIPVILISGTGSPDSRANAMDLGADDYVMKPFHVRELQARMARVVAARAVRPKSRRRATFLTGNVVCDLQRRTISFGESETSLTDTEARILGYLYQNLNQSCSRSMLYKHALFRPYNPEDKTLDVYISRLRKKIGELDKASAEFIQTARGAGYRLSEA